MNYFWFSFALQVSGLLTLLGLVVSVIAHLRKDRAKQILPPLNLFTVFLFAAVLVMYVPIYRYGTGIELELPKWGEIIWLSLQAAIRMFIVDGDYEVINNLPWDGAAIQRPFAGWFAFLLVLAPGVTFTNIMFLFRHLVGEFRFNLTLFRPLCIMSELNDASISMAKSIMEHYTAHKPKWNKQFFRWLLSWVWSKRPLIVFTDVFLQDEEDDYEMVGTIRELRAITMKKDIAHLRLEKRHRWQRIEIFLLGEDEAEVLHQTIMLTEKLKTRKNIAMYVYAPSVNAGYVIDSLDKGSCTLHEEYLANVQQSFQKKEYNRDIGKTLERLRQSKKGIDSGFYLRRIDCVESMVMSTMQQREPFEIIQRQADVSKKISILILGWGDYGKSFLKNAVWFYQKPDCTVEIDVVDEGSTETMEDELAQEAPELVRVNPSTAPGDAAYHIRFHGGINCLSGALDQLLLDNRDRMVHTQLVFVSMGDDDRNIKAAVHLRRLFDRMKGVTRDDLKTLRDDELPMIYSVVFDDQKAENLNIGSTGRNQLKCFGGPAYNIRFIGALASQYSYDAIQQYKKTEEDALLHHVSWVETMRTLQRFFWVKATEAWLRSSLKMPLTNEQKTLLDFHTKVYDYYKAEAVRNTPPGKEVQEPAMEKVLPAPKYNEDGTLQVEAHDYKGEVEKYTTYEYYRDASIAKATYHAFHPELMAEIQDHLYVCTCDKCEAKRIAEHVRWNAFMRSQGFSRGIRNDRAKLHNDLKPWAEIDMMERFKD